MHALSAKPDLTLRQRPQAIVRGHSSIEDSIEIDFECRVFLLRGEDECDAISRRCPHDERDRNVRHDDAGKTVGATEVLERLDRLISENMANVVEKTELYRLVSDPGTDAALVTAVVRHTMLDGFSFTPYLLRHNVAGDRQNAARIAARDETSVSACLRGVGAQRVVLRTFKALGGDESWARDRRMTPGSLAMCGAFDRLVDSISELRPSVFGTPWSTRQPR